jgi:hypothetical protein
LNTLQTQQPTVDPNNLMFQEVQALKNKLAEIENGFTVKEQEVRIQGGVKSMFDEIGDFTKAHPEYATSVPFAELDDLVCSDGLEIAQTKMSPEDFQKYQAIEKLMWLYRGTGDPETDPNAVLDIDDDGKHYGNLEEAYLIFNHRNGSTGFTQGRVAGVEAALKVMDRAANSAQTLPNSMSGKAKVPMTPQEIQMVLDTNPAQRKADPQLKSRWLDAMAQLGIDPNMAG